ncbi:MAG: glucosaminidase domain-containing protein [Duncaniella sp.]|nr:glucosaminidase domain-containing protein [Duncaniella sp.]MDE6328324.1 glucosaminidase domain-containing protein [Duncaniella sp.]
MKTFRLILSFFLFSITVSCASARTPIIGEQKVEIERMYQFVASHNPDFPREVAEAFYEIGERYGIRGDIALCQAVIETGWFRFDNGTAVRPTDHNYCGLGVKRRGQRGCTFNSVEEGVTAMLQHLYAYACKDPLPHGETMLDPRFTYVTRGISSTWEGLSGRWAMNQSYARNILAIYKRMESHPIVPPSAVMTIEVAIPDDAFLEEEELASKSLFE